MLRRPPRAAGIVGRAKFVFLVSLLLVCALVPIRVRAQEELPHPLTQDETCLACHGQAGLTSARGKSISIDPAKHAASVHSALACNDCHTGIKDYPHPNKVAKVQCSSCHSDEASHVTVSIHGVLGDLVQVFAHNLGLTKTEPRFAKFNYAEKVEYWAFMWGTVVMTFSGFLLWFNNFTLHYFPKWVSDAATAVHYYEALLATFSILLWHFYMVIFDPLVYPMDTAWINGKLPADHYRHSRPEYLRALERAHLVEAPTEAADGEEKQAAAAIAGDGPVA